MAIVSLGEIGDGRVKTPLERVCATGKFARIRRMLPRWVLGDALAHRLGNRAFLHSCLSLERPRFG